jgi:hypothetical protein
VVNHLLTKISDLFHKNNVVDANIVTVNGGSLLDLYRIDFKKIDILFWAPNVSNNMLGAKGKKVSGKASIVDSNRKIIYNKPLF